MPVPSITVRRFAKQHDERLTTEDTEFLYKGITQAVVAAAICVHKNLRARPFGVCLLINFSLPLSKDGLKRISL